MCYIRAGVIAAFAASLLLARDSAQVTIRLSIASDGTQGNGDSGFSPISADGRYVAFESQANNLVSGDTNGVHDIFIRDRQSGTTERLSVATSGAEANNASYGPVMSTDGRYVAFDSYASNLVPGDTNGVADIFVRDRQSGTTERVSVGPFNAQANAISLHPSISADGRYVAFCSNASNLVAGDTNGHPDIFVRDRQLGVTERVNVGPGGIQANGDSDSAAISADGRFVAFDSLATNLVAGRGNGQQIQIYIRDRRLGTTEIVSVDSNGTQGNDTSAAPSVSADGRFVAFYGYATNLVTGDTNGHVDVFVRDRRLGTTEIASVDSGGLQGNSDSFSHSISADGRLVVFDSAATNLVNGDTNGSVDAFIHDRLTATTERVSIDTNGQQGNGDSREPSISLDGRYVSFTSRASNLVSGDTNGFDDVFIRDRSSHIVTSLCLPGTAGVLSCPCSNPPSSSGHGCDNSSATGGAALAASGVAYLSMDSVVFTTSGEPQTATSIVLQGNAFADSGFVFGQGVRCANGTLSPLFVKAASAGGIIAPDLGAGDPTVSMQSALLGDTILAGQSRWYLVYYRDPIVLGGCPAASTFNATQTAQITWSL